MQYAIRSFEQMRPGRANKMTGGLGGGSVG